MRRITCNWCSVTFPYWSLVNEGDEETGEEYYLCPYCGMEIFIEED